jgi:hypothetical protein
LFLRTCFGINTRIHRHALTSTHSLRQNLIYGLFAFHVSSPYVAFGYHVLEFPSVARKLYVSKLRLRRRQSALTFLNILGKPAAGVDFSTAFLSFFKSIAL